MLLPLLPIGSLQGELAQVAAENRFCSDASALLPRCEVEYEAFVSDRAWPRISRAPPTPVFWSPETARSPCARAVS